MLEAARPGWRWGARAPLAVPAVAGLPLLVVVEAPLLLEGARVRPVVLWALRWWPVCRRSEPA